MLVTSLAIRPEGADEVSGWAADAGVPVRAAGYGEAAEAGDLTWQVPGPQPVPAWLGGPTTPASCCSCRPTASGSCGR